MLGSFILALLCGMSAWAMPALPKEAAKALKITKGKPIDTGVVFVDGKYLEPPYVVERYGTGIRINKEPVTVEIIAWDEFLKTQEGAKVLNPEPAVEKKSDAPALSLEPADDKKSGDDSLDELFADEPKSKTAKKSPSVSNQVTKKPTVEFSGKFVANDRTKAMVKQINAIRTDIDSNLRQGALLCFGLNYTRVSGDNRTLMHFLETLPKIQKNATSVEDFSAKVRAAGLCYLNDVLCEELFRNRVDYRRLQERRGKITEEQKYNRILNNIQQ